MNRFNRLSSCALLAFGFALLVVSSSSVNAIDSESQGGGFLDLATRKVAPSAACALIGEVQVPPSPLGYQQFVCGTSMGVAYVIEVLDKCLNSPPIGLSFDECMCKMGQVASQCLDDKGCDQTQASDAVDDLIKSFCDE